MSTNPSHRQIAAGRALLGWSQARLAQEAKLGTSTVADFERGHRTPLGKNLRAMKDAIEQAGLVFQDGGVVLSERLRGQARDDDNSVEPATRRPRRRLGRTRSI